MRGRIDQLDLRILAELQEDGRRAFTKIARNLGVSEATVRERVARLIRSRVTQVAAVCDAVELGFSLAWVGIRIRGSALLRAVDSLVKIPEVDYVAVCTGSFDLLIEIVCTDSEHLLRLLGESIRQVPGVEHVETFTTLKIAKETYRWPGFEFAARAKAKA